MPEPGHLLCINWHSVLATVAPDAAIAGIAIPWAISPTAMSSAMTSERRLHDIDRTYTRHAPRINGREGAPPGHNSPHSQFITARSAGANSAREVAHGLVSALGPHPPRHSCLMKEPISEGTANMAARSPPSIPVRHGRSRIEGPDLLRAGEGPSQPRLPYVRQRFRGDSTQCT